jgi:DNA-binding FrmR family transcriptional regulator
MTKKTKNQLLIDRTSRLIGQLESIKRSLNESEIDCVQISQTLKASSRSFTSLKKAFIECYLEKEFLKKSVDTNNPTYQALLNIINS